MWWYRVDTRINHTHTHSSVMYLQWQHTCLNPLVLCCVHSSIVWGNVPFKECCLLHTALSMQSPFCPPPPTPRDPGARVGVGGRAVDSTHPGESNDTRCDVIVLKTATLSAWLKKINTAIEIHVLRIDWSHTPATGVGSHWQQWQGMAMAPLDAKFFHLTIEATKYRGWAPSSRKIAAYALANYVPHTM